MTPALSLSSLPSPSWIWSHRGELDGVLTLQAKHEPGYAITQAVVNSGLRSWSHPYTIKRWNNVPFQERQRFKKELIEIAARLRQGERILVHCAAGIHRTGCNGWALCVYYGMSEDEATSHVLTLRPEAADFVRFLPWARKELLP